MHPAPRPNGRGLLREWTSQTLNSAAFARAFTLTALGVVFAQFAITQMAGSVAYFSMLAGLVVIGAALLVRRRRRIDPLHLLPTTLVLFVVWLLVSLIWTTDTLFTLGGWLATAGVAFVAIVVAHVRDTLQTIRALGTVFRTLLSLSLGLEILSGILLDLPIDFLSIEGHITSGGPVQGLFGTRNMLGFVAMLALVTFIIEWRTRTVRRGVAVFSVVLAGSLALLSGSPTALVLLIAVSIATGALALVRHTPAPRRTAAQITLGATLSIALIVAYLLRGPIIGVLDARGGFSIRSDLWDALLILVRIHPVEGWGWHGPWPVDESPFALINSLTGSENQSALNAYLDVLLQAGWVGLLVFAVMCTVAFVRAWLVASTLPSVVYAWTPLTLVVLLVNGVFESFAVVGAGWMLLVLCVVRAGLTRSWRTRPDASPRPATDDTESAPSAGV